MTTDDLVTASGASVTYHRGGAPSLHPTDVRIPRGQALGIVGESGSGKTTLARVLVGSQAPSQGEVAVAGTPWSKVRGRHPLRRSVQMIFQDPFGSLNPSLTALETVAEVFRFWEQMDRRAATEAARRMLGEVGLGPEAMEHRPGRLSGGQCQRVGIARALACRPQVVVADEPTSALDASVQAQILNLLETERAGRDLALVLVSHDLQVVRHATDHVLVMYGGWVVEEGPTRQVLTSPRHPYTRALVESQVGRSRSTAADAGPATSGCVYSARCPRVADDCRVAQPALRQMDGLRVACLHPVERPAA